LRELLARVFGYLQVRRECRYVWLAVDSSHLSYSQKDTLRVKVNLQAEMQVKRVRQQQFGSQPKDIVAVIKSCEGTGSAPLEVGMDFNLVTLADDITAMGENALAW
jgi:hypothetical protein